MLLFHVGDNRFAIDSSSILRIVPFVILNKISTDAPYLAGMLNYHGKGIPVVDFCQLIEGRATNHRLNSRIILLKKNEKMIGLLGERVEETLDLPVDSFQKNEFFHHRFPFLEKGFNDAKGMIQLIQPDEFFLFLEIYAEKDGHGN